MTQLQQVLDFWFNELIPAQWFTKDPALDEQIKQRFGALHQQASASELFGWRDTAQGRLAEIIVLDQFSRNIWRDQPQAFAADTQALALAQEGVRLGVDQALSVIERSFFYMPYMHSESLIIHQQAVQLYRQPGLEVNLDFEYKHLAILQRFGRYPHRNTILGRVSTEEELAFLKQPGSSF